MTEQIKRQLIKALAYGKSREEIKECMSISDEDINNIAQDEVDKEKAYYREMGYLQ